MKRSNRPKVNLRYTRDYSGEYFTCYVHTIIAVNSLISVESFYFETKII